MKALIYLTKRSLINNLKQACRKPLTLILLIFGIVYGIFVVAMLGGLALAVHIDSPKGLAGGSDRLEHIRIPGQFYVLFVQEGDSLPACPRALCISFAGQPEAGAA